MSSTTTTEPQRCMFVTLGMLVLDELHFPAQNPRLDVIGGSGTYACLGARLFIPPSLSCLIGWLIRTGDDFPRNVKEYIQDWNMLLLEKRMIEHMSTRGKLIYQDTLFGAKTFQYTTQPLKIEPKHLLDTPLISSQSFHFLTSPNDIIDQVPELFKLRSSCGIQELPMIIWEPSPLFCTMQHLDACLQAVGHVDVFSPNHIEFAKLFDLDLSRDEQFDRGIVEDLCQRFLHHGIGSTKTGTIAIRAGHEGCCVYTKRKDLVWLPPFHVDPLKVIDPTGAGNAFLGGFAIGLLETGDDLVAACYGTVASSFALEQIGLPIHESLSRLNADGKLENTELWNGACVRGRLQEYMSKVGIVINDHYDNHDNLLAPEASISSSSNQE